MNRLCNYFGHGSIQPAKIQEYNGIKDMIKKTKNSGFPILFCSAAESILFKYSNVFFYSV
ncbi:hypothetical protein DERP_008441 [Dermatophagoides pteronyssinus]|uniref:Uncharacterized protein n=1 Tax=Dermatophagoides pteronyssinus TaxID=6956 RepID=A0ABQ8IVA1_DERPT|nr:hypothetical protein DERP_008441 [Dermatophagoides pteronyssinus]